MRDVKKIIDALLNTAGRTEEETKEALMKAQEMMAKYKIEEKDLLSKQNKVVDILHSGVWYTKNKQGWIGSLGCVMAKNYCCKVYNDHQYRSHKYEICFIGLEDDVKVCMVAFKYAVGYVLNWCNKAMLHYSEYDTKDKNTLCYDYAIGFVIGVNTSFDSCKENNEELALAIVVPKEVSDVFNNLNLVKGKAKKRKIQYQDAYSTGFNDGYKFNPVTILQ